MKTWNHEIQYNPVQNYQSIILKKKTNPSCKPVNHIEIQTLNIYTYKNIYVCKTEKSQTHSFSRSSGVSLGVPKVLTSLWNVETAVLIWKIPEATAWVGSCFPFAIPPLRNPTDRPASRSWKLIVNSRTPFSQLINKCVYDKTLEKFGGGELGEIEKRGDYCL